MDRKHSATSQEFIAKEKRFGAKNYAPVPVVVDHAKDCII